MLIWEILQFSDDVPKTQNYLGIHNFENLWYSLIDGAIYGKLYSMVFCWVNAFEGHFLARIYNDSNEEINSCH